MTSTGGELQCYAELPLSWFTPPTLKKSNIGPSIFFYLLERTNKISTYSKVKKYFESGSWNILLVQSNILFSSK